MTDHLDGEVSSQNNKPQIVKRCSFSSGITFRLICFWVLLLSFSSFLLLLSSSLTSSHWLSLYYRHASLC